MHNIKALAIAASTEKSDLREVLKSVLFTGGKAVATDGFIMALMDCVVIPGMRTAKPYTKMKKNDDLSISGAITTEDGELLPENIEGNYPPYKTLLSEDVPAFEVGIGLHVLEKLTKMVKASDGDVVKLQFRSVEDNLKPISFEILESGITGVMMPVRMG